jgi:glycosyltransferase involved in cell wall biosynthesis
VQIHGRVSNCFPEISLMKIIAVLESGITSGGAFNQGLNAIMQMNRICKGRFEFEVFSTHASNKNELDKLGIDCTLVKFTVLDKLIARFASSSLGHRIQSRLKICGPFEKKVITHRCDLVYFLTHSSSTKSLQQTNFITTVFDLCHRDTPEFPEVSDFGVFQRREIQFKNNLTQAIIVITESERLSDLVARRYGVDRKRCLAIPMSASPFLHRDHSDSRNLVLGKYNLDENYFFYPAQFWSHKNHIRILEALIHLRDEGNLYKVVFVGSDKGNQKHVEDFIAQNSLGEQVRLLGFVPAQEMRGLYEACTAVIMPTYFGPTNLPPIEAWSAGKPLIYSLHLEEHSGDAAIKVNPDDAGDIAEAMKKCMHDDDLVASLVDRGKLRLQHFERLHEIAENELTRRLLQYEVRRRCWASPGS